jgi:excisionase family DNA binding protein
MTVPPDLLYPEEAARMLGVHHKTLARWAAAGRLRVIVTPGGHRRYLRADVERILAPPGCDGSSG